MRIVSFVLIAILLVSCNSEKKKKDNSNIEVAKTIVQSFESPVQGNSSLPRLFASNNKLYLSWVEKKDTVSFQNYSIFEDGSWSDAQSVVSGSDWFVNWADFPAIAESNGNILTSYLQKSATGTYTYDVKLNLFNASTNSWKKNFILHNDGTQSEHGFVSIRPYSGNSFLIVWLDGRDTVGKDHGGGQMTLRGAIVFEDGTIDYDTLLDDRVCDCCQTSVTIGPEDEIIVAYRDRSDDEIRDISVVRWEKETGWSKPMTIGNDNWKIAGCPVNGPSIDSKDTNVGLAWFSAVNGEGKVQVAFSTDSGISFGKPIRIDAGSATGRVDIQMISKTEAAVLWMEPKGDDELIQIVKVNVNGSKGKAITVSKTSAERASGFPQLELMGNDLYIAWTEIQAETSSVKTVLISDQNL